MHEQLGPSIFSVLYLQCSCLICGGWVQGGTPSLLIHAFLLCIFCNRAGLRLVVRDAGILTLLAWNCGRTQGRRAPVWHRTSVTLSCGVWMGVTYGSNVTDACCPHPSYYIFLNKCFSILYMPLVVVHTFFHWWSGGSPGERWSSALFPKPHSYIIFQKLSNYHALYI